jgi:hypothetical protein
MDVYVRGLSAEVHEALRREAFETKRSLNRVVRDLLLEKFGNPVTGKVSEPGLGSEAGPSQATVVKPRDSRGALQAEASDRSSTGSLTSSKFCKHGRVQSLCIECEKEKLEVKKR